MTFQPPQPPASPSPSAASQPTKAAPKPAELNLIQRYKLQDQVDQAEASETPAGKGKAWRSSPQERQKNLQQTRNNVILEARRKMQAKLEAEKAGKAS